jgi:hypothetical protein
VCLSCEPVLGVYLVWLVRIDSSSSGLNWLVQTRTGSDFSNWFWKWNQNWIRTKLEQEFLKIKLGLRLTGS